MTDDELDSPLLAFFSLASAARSALISSQAEITLAQISAGKVPPITGPPL